MAAARLGREQEGGHGGRGAGGCLGTQVLVYRVQGLLDGILAGQLGVLWSRSSHPSPS